MVSVRGTALAFVGLALLLVFLWAPEVVSGVLSLESVRVPVVPICILLLGAFAVLLSLQSRVALWIARVGLVLVLVACASVLTSVQATPFSFMEGAFTLWSTPEGVWPQARAEIWIAAGAIVLFLATVRSRAGVSASQWSSLVVIGASLFASLVFVLSSGAPVSVQLVSAINALVAQACAVCALHESATGDGFKPGGEAPRARRFLLAVCATSTLLPIVAIPFSLLFAGGITAAAAGLMVATLAIVTLCALVAIGRRESAHRETAHELSIALDDRDGIETAGGYGSWKLDTVHGVLQLSSHAGRILRTDSLRASADSIADGAHPDDSVRVSEWLERVRNLEGSHCATVRNVKGGDVRWVEYCAVRAHQDDYPIVFGTVRDVTTDATVRAKLEQGISLLQALSSNIPDIEYVYDVRAREYVYTNRPIGELLGDAGLESGTILEDHVLQHHREALYAHILKVTSLEDGESAQAEFMVSRPDGGPVWVRSRASVYQRDTDGSPTLIHGTLQDVSVRRGLEQRLQESEGRFERISDRTPGVIFQFAIGADGAISIPYMSAGCVDVFGVTSDVAESMPMQVMDMVHDDERAGLMEAIEASRQQLADFSWTGQIGRPDGTAAWIQVMSRPMRHSDGSTVWDGVVIDVTIAKEAQEALRKTKDRLDYLLSESPTVVYECEPYSPYRIVSVAPNIRTLLGYVPEQLAGRSVFGAESVHESDRTAFRAHEQRFVDHGRSTAEYRLRTISNDYVWVRDDVRIVSSGSATADVVGSWTDITAQRRSMESTARSEDRLERLASLVPGMVFELALHDEVKPEFTYVSAGSYSLLDLPPEELRARPESFLRLIHDQDKAGLYRDLVRTRRDMSDLLWEGLVTLATGRKKWLRMSARPRASDDGEVSWSGVLTDVTELQEAHSALAEQVLQYSALVNSSSEVIVSIDSAGIIESLNPRAERAFGYLSHELVGKPLGKLAAEGHSHPLALEESDAGKRIMVGVRKRDGEVATFEVTVVVYDVGGKRHLTGIFSEVPSPQARFALVASTEGTARETPVKAEQTLPGVLFIAREREIDQLLGPGVRMAGLSVTVATTAGLGLEFAKRTRPDAVVIVDGLPGTDIVSALEAIRADDDLRSVPVVVLGAPTDRRERLLRSGATVVADRAELQQAIRLAVSRA